MRLRSDRLLRLLELILKLFLFIGQSSLSSIKIKAIGMGRRWLQQFLRDVVLVVDEGCVCEGRRVDMSNHDQGVSNGSDGGDESDDEMGCKAVVRTPAEVMPVKPHLAALRESTKTRGSNV